MRIIKLILKDILPILPLLLFSFGEIFRSDSYLVLAFVLIMPFLMIYVSENGINKSILIFTVLVFVGSLLNLFVTQNGVGGTILFLTNICLSLYCLTHIKIVKYVAIIILCYNFQFLYKNIFIDGINPNYIYEEIGLSRNYPGMLLILWSCFWGFCKYLTEGKVSVVVPILSCVLAFFLEGRSSLGILLFMSIVSICLRDKKFLFILPLVGSVVMFAYWDIVLDIYSLTSFAENSLETSRYSIWKAYFEALDLVSILGGLDVSEVPLIRSYANNPHNALLNYHYRMGLMGVVALLYLVCKSVKRYINSYSFMPLLYLSCILVRFMFDACINSTYDFILYSMLFCPILFKKENVFIFSNLYKKESLFTRIFSAI